MIKYSLLNHKIQKNKTKITQIKKKNQSCKKTQTQQIKCLVI